MTGNRSRGNQGNGKKVQQSSTTATKPSVNGKTAGKNSQSEVRPEDDAADQQSKLPDDEIDEAAADWRDNREPLDDVPAPLDNSHYGSEPRENAPYGPEPPAHAHAQYGPEPPDHAHFAPEPRRSAHIVSQPAWMNFYNPEFLKIVQKQDDNVQICLDSLWQAFHSCREEIRAQRQEIEDLTHSSSKNKDARELVKLKRDFERLQTEALKSVDKFQPTTDEIMESQFTRLGIIIPSLVTLLFKQAGRPKDEKWQAALIKCSAPGSVDAGAPDLGIENTRIQKAVLGNAIWFIMGDSLLRRPLAGYGGRFSDTMAGAFKKLFPNPIEDLDSGLWRSVTAPKLAALAKEENGKLLEKDLMAELAFQLKSLGFDFTETTVQAKVGRLVQDVIKFARILSTQRALFEFEFPVAEGGNLEKKEDSEFMSCPDSEACELAGIVRFVCTPALVKRGKGTGQDLHISTCLIKAKVSLFGVDE